MSEDLIGSKLIVVVILAWVGAAVIAAVLLSICFGGRRR